MRMRKRVAGVVLGAALAACGSPSVTDPQPIATDKDVIAREFPPLGPAEVRIFLTNSTLRHAGKTRVWTVYLAADGSMSGLATAKDGKGGQERARGRWEVLEDGRFCRDWDGDWGEGDSGCALIYKEGETYRFVAEGEDPRKGGLRRTRLPGNPGGL